MMTAMIRTMIRMVMMMMTTVADAGDNSFDQDSNNARRWQQGTFNNATNRMVTTNVDTNV